MNAKYEIHFHDREKMEAKVFQDFDSLERYIVVNKTMDWERRVNVHLPWHATDQQRARIRELGFESTYGSDRGRVED